MRRRYNSTPYFSFAPQTATPRRCGAAECTNILVAGKPSYYVPGRASGKKHYCEACTAAQRERLAGHGLNYCGTLAAAPGI